MPRTEQTNTAERILEVAQDLIQRRGYNAISFEDIAKKVGIKKPSIVHHYASKAALGRAVVRRYRSNFSSMLDDIARDPEKTAADALAFYFVPYLDFGATKDKICLCGALSGEFMALPKTMQTEVAAFFQDHQSWLEGILRRGRENKELQVVDEDPAAAAAWILDALHGSLIIKRATNDPGHVQRLVDSLKAKYIRSSSG
ncbi:MAG: TetR/AcrR family transcriptional regulator [bacterium]|nr:TetR/AcrR family transcriptional regulator [bacterium]